MPIVLANGWYYIEEEFTCYRYMNDGRMSGLRSKDINDLARNDTEFIEKVLIDWKNTQRAGVVVTHTAPCLDTLNPAYEGHYSNAWYWNPGMRDLLSKYSNQIKVWCHGHTHAPSDKIVEGVRVVCNPRGYPGENPEWSPITIEI